MIAKLHFHVTGWVCCYYYKNEIQRNTKCLNLFLKFELQLTGYERAQDPCELELFKSELAEKLKSYVILKFQLEQSFNVTFQNYSGNVAYLWIYEAENTFCAQTKKFYVENLTNIMYLRRR